MIDSVSIYEYLCLNITLVCLISGVKLFLLLRKTVFLSVQRREMNSSDIFIIGLWWFLYMSMQNSSSLKTLASKRHAASWFFPPPPLWFVDSWSFCTLITVWATGTWLDNKHGLFLSCCWTLVNSLSRYLLLLVLSLLLFLSALLARTCL